MAKSNIGGNVTMQNPSTMPLYTRFEILFIHQYLQIRIQQSQTFSVVKLHILTQLYFVDLSWLQFF